MGVGGVGWCDGIREEGSWGGVELLSWVAGEPR